MAPKKIFGIVLAGGEGKRLMPLTADRAKPAVPFGGDYRLDRLRAVEPDQLGPAAGRRADPVQVALPRPARVADLAPVGLLDSYVASVPAQQRLGKRWFSGSADAILQSLNLIRDEKPDIVCVVGADHVYRMDFSQMIDAHIASRHGRDGRRDPPADRAGRPVRRDRGRREEPGEDRRVPREAARTPRASPTRPSEVLASMGNYVFDADVLIDAVHRDGDRADSNHDMGGDIIPDFVARGEAGVYDLKRNDVPGSTDRDRYYWRDVGTIESFFDAHQDLISTLPIFNLYNRDWPIFSQQLNSPPAKFVRDASRRIGTAIDSIVSLGSVLSGAHLERSGARSVDGRRSRVRRSSTRCSSSASTSARAPSSSARSSTRTSSSMPARRSASTTTRTSPAASPSPRPASRSSARACTSRSSSAAREEGPTPHGALPRRARRRLDAHRNEVIELLADEAGSAERSPRSPAAR